MATVTVDQTSDAGTAQLRLGAFAVQRFLTAQSITEAEKVAAVAAMGSSVDAIAYHWSGGLGGATFGYTDFAPTSMGSARNWSSGNRDPDEQMAAMDRLIAVNPNAKFVIVLFDHPGAALNSPPDQITTRTQGSYVRWESITDGMYQNMCTLLDEWFARFGTSRFLAVSYGQEGKGIQNRSITSGSNELNRFARGASIIHGHLAANYPTIERWYPHWNNWSTESSVSARTTAMTNLLAGGGFSNADDTIQRRLMQQIDPALITRYTTDNSIYNISGETKSYANAITKVDLEYHVARALRDLMSDEWSTAKPIVAIESYFDVSQSDNEWANVDVNGTGPTINSTVRRNPTQSSTLTTAMLMAAMKGEISYHFRWEPQEGDQGNEAPDGNIASWFDKDGLPYYALTAAKALVAAIPPGTTMFTASSDNGSIQVVAGGTKAFLLNTSVSPISVTVQGTSGSAAPVSVPAYSVQVVTLPSVTNPPEIEEIAFVQDKAALGNGGSPTVVTTFDQQCTAGNLLVLFGMLSENASSGSINDPAGWGPPKVEVDNPTNNRQYLWTKISDGTETAVTITATITQRIMTCFMEFSGAESATPEDTNTAQGTAQTLGCGPLTPPLPGRLLVAGIGNKVANSVQTEGNDGYSVSERANEASASGQTQFHSGYWKIQGPSATSEETPTISGGINRAFTGIHASFAPRTLDPQTHNWGLLGVG